MVRRYRDQSAPPTLSAVVADRAEVCQRVHALRSPTRGAFGMSLRRIAREVEVDMHTVQRYLAADAPPQTAHGVPLRRRGEENEA